MREEEERERESGGERVEDKERGERGERERVRGEKGEYTINSFHQY